MRILGVIATGLLLMASTLGSAYAQSGVVTATVRPNPLKVSVSAPPSVPVGHWFEISAEITNLGSATIARTMVTINSSGEVSATIRGQKKKIGNLAGHEKETVSWLAKVNSPGNFVIQVEAAGSLDGEQISSSDSVTVSAVESFALFLLRLIPGVSSLV